MLKFTEVLNTTDKKKLLQDFNPNQGLWLTSDIKSQFFVTKQLQKNNSFLANDCVKRGTDFWYWLLSLTHSKIHILPRSFLVLIYQQWANYRKRNWEKSRETGYLICEYIETLSHLLQHPMRDSLVREWNKKNKNVSWSKWYDLASDFWDYLKQNNIVESSWVASCLLDKIPYERIKFTEIVFDLGFNIDRIEAELVQQISKKIDTTVLIPSSAIHKINDYTLAIYQLFDQRKISRPIEKKIYNAKSIITLKKFTTPLSEVKDIVSQITSALKRNIPANQITVLAPHIENYWTCLNSYLIREKIPVNKSQIVSLHTFPFIQFWLAKIETHLSIVKYENMEIIYSNQRLCTDFNRLKAHFYNVKKIEDWPTGTYTMAQLRNKNELTTAEDFINWAQELFPDIKSSTAVEQSIKNCLNHFSHLTNLEKKVKLTWQSWFNLLEGIVKKEEVKIQEENLQGINCLSFNALGWVESDFIYIAGLSEQNLKTEKHNIISSLEAESITENLGFFIKSESLNKQERIISHFIHQGHKELVLSFSSTDFLGTPLNPSYFWLEKAMEHKKNIHHFDTPGSTIWDQQQRKYSIKEILSHTDIQSSRLKLMEQSIIEDQEYIKPFYQKSVKNLSPSALDDYIKCPFIFAARKVFHLWDGVEKDTDIPAIERGIMVHRLFEILQTMPEEEISEKNILQIIETVKSSNKLNQKDFSFLNFEHTSYPVQEKQQQEKLDQINVKESGIHPVIWEKEKSWLLKKAMIFLKEKQKRKILFNNYKTKHCEKQYHCYWDFKVKSQSNRGEISFKGKIDYIDSDGQSYQIIDYKNSLPTGASAPSWEIQQNFQLAFYIQALERGLTDLPPLPVKSALYLSYKSFDYQGLANKEPAYIELLGSSKKRSLVSKEQKEIILQNINEKINNLFLNIYNGKFRAQPKTKTLCIKCRWRKICRANHLN